MPPIAVRERFLASLHQRLSALKTVLPTVPVVHPPSSFPSRLMSNAHTGTSVTPLFSGPHIPAGDADDRWARAIVREAPRMSPPQLDRALERLRPWAIQHVETLRDNPDPRVMAALELLVDQQVLTGREVQDLHATARFLLHTTDDRGLSDAVRLYVATVRSGYVPAAEIDDGVRHMLRSLGEREARLQLPLMWGISLVLPWMERIDAEIVVLLRPLAEHLMTEAGTIRPGGVLALHVLEELRDRLHVQIPNGGPPWPELWKKHGQDIVVPDHVRRILDRLGMRVDEWMDPATDVKHWAELRLDPEARRDLRLDIAGLDIEQVSWNRMLRRLMDAVTSPRDRLGLRARLEMAIAYGTDDVRQEKAGLLRAEMLGYGKDPFRALQDVAYLKVAGSLSGADKEFLRAGAGDLNVYNREAPFRSLVTRKLLYWHRELLTPQTLAIALPMDVRRLVVMREVVQTARQMSPKDRQKYMPQLREMVRVIRGLAGGPPLLVAQHARYALRDFPFLLDDLAE